MSEEKAISVDIKQKKKKTTRKKKIAVPEQISSFPTSKQKKKNRRKLSAKQKQQLRWKKRMKLATTIFEYLLFFIFAVACFIFLVRYQTHVVSGKSMAPTFENGDRVLVKKGAALDRYDIITFQPPNEKKQDSYIKRIIGMPGDKMYIQGNRLFLLRKNSPELTKEQMIYTGNLPDSVTILELTEQGASLLKEVSVIPKNTYFVVGDNRENSKDSRDIGLIPRRNIEGVVASRYFPLSKIGTVH